MKIEQKNVFFQKTRIKLTTLFYKNAVERIMKKLKPQGDDIIYSHFICPSGVVAAKLAKKYNLRAYMAHGEAIYSGNRKYGNDYLRKCFSNLSGVIAVSTQNKEFLVNANVIDENKVKVFPNGYREERFYKIDKAEARKKMGFNQKDFIVGFCGSFDDRKACS